MNKKIIVLLVIALSSIMAQAQEIKWMTLEEALAAQKKNPKKIIMDVYTDWCGPCKMLDKNTFQNKDVTAYINDNYYAVKFNAEGNQEITYKDKVFTNPKYDAAKKGRNATHDLTMALRITGYPTIVFFDEKGNYLSPLVGYYTPERIEIYLKTFSKEKYKEFTSKEEWDKYHASFKNEFNN